jgi:N-acetyl-anhydromuramyl-L-alanine amidase AmpD
MSGSRNDAIHFFLQLSVFSERVFSKLGICNSYSPWSQDGLDFKGAIIHYTGGTDPFNTIRWFMKRKFQEEIPSSKRSSAHLVVADGWPEGMKSFAWDLDSIKILESMIVECVPPNRKAWHAGWANTEFYGIEIVNRGPVLAKNKEEEKGTVRVNDRNWEMYTFEQLASVSRVVRHLKNLRGDRFDTNLVLGHEHVQKNKRDPGPLFPMAQLRDFLTKYESAVGGWTISCLDHVDDMRNRLLHGYARSKMTWDLVFDSVRSSSSVCFDPWYKAMFRLLGYPTSVGGDGVCHVDTQSIKIFQRMMGLKRDGIPGAKTKAAILDRAISLGFLEQ